MPLSPCHFSLRHATYATIFAIYAALRLMMRDMIRHAMRRGDMRAYYDLLKFTRRVMLFLLMAHCFPSLPLIYARYRVTRYASLEALLCAPRYMFSPPRA